MLSVEDDVTAKGVVESLEKVGATIQSTLDPITKTQGDATKMYCYIANIISQILCTINFMLQSDWLLAL